MGATEPAKGEATEATAQTDPQAGALRRDWEHRDFQDVKARFGLRSPSDLGASP